MGRTKYWRIINEEKQLLSNAEWDILSWFKLIGHNSAATTLNIYTHITDEMQKSAAEKIGQNLRRNISLSNKV